MTKGVIDLSAGTISNLSSEFSNSTESERAKIFSLLIHSNVLYSDATVSNVNGTRKAVILCTDKKHVLYQHLEHKGHDGLTMTIGDRIMPNLIGIDIGCGMTLGKIKGKKIEGQKLDTVIRDCVPSGFNTRKKPHRFADDFNFPELYCSSHIRTDKARLSLGTLGGGNHFIEVDRDTDNDLYIVIHTGSRHLGKEVTEYYLNEGQKALKDKGIAVPYELTWREHTRIVRGNPVRIYKGMGFTQT